MTGEASNPSLLACRSVDHLAYTVPDLDQAVAFFRNVLGAEELYRSRGPDAAGAATFAERFNAHADGSYKLAKLSLCGTAFELFEYHAADLRSDPPRNCDAGGCHFSVTVDDVDAAAELLRRQPGVRVLGESSQILSDHPLKGRRWVYVLAPWGLQIELVSPLNSPSDHSETR